MRLLPNCFMNKTQILYITIPAQVYSCSINNRNTCFVGENTITLAPLYKYTQRQTDSIHLMTNQHATGGYQEQEEKEEDSCMCPIPVPVCWNNLSAHFSDCGGMSAVVNLTANNEGRCWTSLDFCSHGDPNKQ